VQDYRLGETREKQGRKKHCLGKKPKTGKRVHGRDNSSSAQITPQHGVRILTSDGKKKYDARQINTRTLKKQEGRKGKTWGEAMD